MHASFLFYQLIISSILNFLLLIISIVAFIK
uniref:Uncharacterized protein n=1 Tax=Podoviridae sp. ctlSr7 TaxID=2826573 RepID=A0A8S5MY33_9CAUD|nr:MAG TPA: hypothetical protein [Podoviridae sp. ctlSr7]